MGLRPVLVVVAIFLLAIGLRAWDVAQPRLWADELFSLRFSNAIDTRSSPLPEQVVLTDPRDTIRLDSAGPVTAVPGAMLGDTHPPLHPLLLRLWREALGEGEVVARAFSLVWGLLLLVLIYDTTRRTFDRATATIALALATVAWPLVLYASEIRSYGMLAALVMLATWAAVRVVQRGARLGTLAWLAGASLAAMLTHYFAAGSMVVLGLYLLVTLRGRDRLRAVAACATAALLFAALWGPSFLRQRANFDTNMRWIADESPGLLPRTIGRALDVPVRVLLPSVEPGVASRAGVIVALVAASVALFRGRFGDRNAAGRRGATENPGATPAHGMIGRRNAVLFMLAMAVVPILLVALGDLAMRRRTLGEVRYVLHAVGPMLIAIAACVVTGPRGTRTAPRLLTRTASQLPTRTTSQLLTGTASRVDDSDSPGESDGSGTNAARPAASAAAIPSADDPLPAGPVDSARADDPRDRAARGPRAGGPGTPESDAAPPAPTPAIALGLLAIVVIATALAYPSLRDARHHPQWKPVVEHLERHRGPDELLIVHAPEDQRWMRASIYDALCAYRTEPLGPLLLGDVDAALPDLTAQSDAGPPGASFWLLTVDPLPRDTIGPWRIDPTTRLGPLRRYTRR